MKTIFLYEYATAGGAWAEWDVPDLVRELRSEGAAMHRALAEDLRSAGVSVIGINPSDHNRSTTAERQVRFQELAQRADAVILLAPEIGGILFGLVEYVESLGRPLLSANGELVRVASNKHATNERLRERKVPCTRGILQRAGIMEKVPWSGTSVCKPCDGAGSWHVQQFENAIGPLTFDARLEPFYPGTPASVALLCGPSGAVALEPCRQRLGGTSGFEYLGGSLPLPKPQAARARSLALRTLDALPPAIGYIGVDLVLGDGEDGSGDVVIEVNPRLTTSYIGLRRAYRENLAAAWLQIAGGNPFELSAPDRALEFSADGTVKETFLC